MCPAIQGNRNSTVPSSALDFQIPNAEALAEVVRPGLFRDAAHNVEESSKKLFKILVPGADLGKLRCPVIS